MFLLLKIQKLLCRSQCAGVCVGGSERCKRMWKEDVDEESCLLTSWSRSLYVHLLLESVWWCWLSLSCTEIYKGKKINALLNVRRYIISEPDDTAHH